MTVVESHGGKVAEGRFWFEGDVPPEQVPEKYRLRPAFVPKSRYLDPEFLQLELDRVFTRTWLMACREEELLGVGSYVEHLIHNTSILIVREGPKSIKAYYNACRHRGTRLAEGRGRVGSIICPFHGWRWNLDGTIRLQLDDEEFTPRSQEDLGLQPVRCETWGGFVFINQDLNAQPLLEYLDPIPTIFEPFKLENMRYKFMKQVHLPCNWKAALDGFLEAYHVPGTHPQLFRANKANVNLVSLGELEQRSWSPTTVYERHAHYSAVGQKKVAVVEAKKKDPNNRGTDGVEDMRDAYARSVEYIFDDMKAQETEISVAAARALRTTEIPDGQTIGDVYTQLHRDMSIAEGYEWTDITPEQWGLAGTAWNVFPNTILLPSRGSIIIYRARPLGTDPDQCIFELGCIEQIPIADYDKPHPFEPQFFEDYHQGDLGVVWEQDLDNSINVTTGMHSPSFDGHRLSEEQEMTIYNHHRVADRYLWTD